MQTWNETGNDAEVLEIIGEGRDNPFKQDQLYNKVLQESNINIEGELNKC